MTVTAPRAAHHFGMGGLLGGIGSVGSAGERGGDGGNVPASEPSQPRRCLTNSDPTLLQRATGIAAGAIDALSLGLYTGIGSQLPGNRVSDVTGTKEYTATVGIVGLLGLGRIGYAARAISFGRLGGREAVAARNSLKGTISGLGSRHPRIKSYDELLAKYGSDKAVADAAARTNKTANIAGASAAGTAAARGVVCGSGL